jgi:CheY-like chemotaxis protein
MEMAREKGFKCLAATRGDVGVAMARRYQPDAITLDINLPVMDGWTVLDRLKHDPATRHIPVHIISLLEEAHRGMRLGAMAHLAKPVERDALEHAFTSIAGFIDRKVRNLLIVEDNDVERQSIVELIGDGDVKSTAVATGGEALQAFLASAPAASRFREFCLGFNPKLVVPAGETALPYYGYGDAVVRLSLGDNEEVGGSVRGGGVRWLFFPRTTVTVGSTTLVKDGKLVKGAAGTR